MKIFKHKDPVLFQKAREVLPEEFGSELEDTMLKMTMFMYGSNGVGLAAPQVGDSRRMLVALTSYPDNSKLERVIHMVNPEIVSSSFERVKFVEGCLSYPQLEVPTLRPKSITVKFFSPLGEQFVQEFRDMSSVIICHEIDHLNGFTLYSRADLKTRDKYDQSIASGDIKL